MLYIGARAETSTRVKGGEGREVEGVQWVLSWERGRAEFTEFPPFFPLPSPPLPSPSQRSEGSGSAGPHLSAGLPGLLRHFKQTTGEDSKAGGLAPVATCTTREPDSWLSTLPWQRARTVTLPSLLPLPVRRSRHVRGWGHCRDHQETDDGLRVAEDLHHEPRQEPLPEPHQQPVPHHPWWVSVCLSDYLLYHLVAAPIWVFRSQFHQIFAFIDWLLCPTPSGNDEVKRGVFLMLFGGVPKTTTEGTHLRGDINVCIVGDPSTAKSQFLKWVWDDIMMMS